MADTDARLDTGPTAEDLRVFYEGRVRHALAEAQVRNNDPTIELAEPEGWWNIWAIGPIQQGTFQPSQIIRAGERAYVVTVVWLNAFYPSPSACSVISNLGCTCEVNYCTGDLCSWERAPGYSGTHSLQLVPNQCWYVDVLEIAPPEGARGLFEMNISAWLTGCHGGYPPFAAYATAVLDIDADIFYPSSGPVPTPAPGAGPRWQFDIPIRFMVFP